MEPSRLDLVHHLAHHSGLNCVDHGRRMELVAALLLMRSCDAGAHVADFWQ